MEPTLGHVILDQLRLYLSHNTTSRLFQEPPSKAIEALLKAVWLWEKIKGHFELFQHNVTSRAPGKHEIFRTLAER